MCESDGLSENEKPLPGEKQAERGGQLGALLTFVTFFALIGGLVCTIFLQTSLPWVPLIVEALVLWVLGFGAAFHFDRAWLVLRGEHEKLKHELKHKQAELDSLHAFNLTNPVAVENVDGRIHQAAVLVGKALKAKTALYQGHWGVAFAGWPDATDEKGAGDLRRKFEARATELETDLVNALSEFQRRRDLAKRRGFVVKEAWQDYVFSPTPNFEDLNESAGQ